MNRLKELRKAKKLKQVDIANYLNITSQAYGHYENNQRDPDPETLKKLADYFNVTIDYLLEKEEKPLTEVKSYIEYNQTFKKLRLEGNIEEQKKLIQKIANLSDEQKKLISQLVDNFKDKTD